MKFTVDSRLDVLYNSEGSGHDALFPIMSSKSPSIFQTYIDFFAGCGGLSLGLGWAGWKGVFAIEKDPMAFETFKRNLLDSRSPNCHFRSWPSWLSQEAHRIEDVLEDPVALAGFQRLSGRVDLVAGGPPCQGFSVAGARNGGDPRNLLVFKQIRAIDILRPKFALVENVEGFEKKFVLKPGGHGAVSVAEEAIGQLRSIGYNVGKVVINAADFGVPQLRRRVILFAISKEFAGDIQVVPFVRHLLFKTAIEQRIKLGLPLDRPVNIGEAISDLAGEDEVPDGEFPGYRTCRYLPAKGAYQKLMRNGRQTPDIPTCHRFNRHSEKVVGLYRLALQTQPAGRLSKEFLYANGCHSNKRYVLDVSKPCSTLTTAPEEIIHFKHPRIATLREMARIQSFPDNFRFYGRYTLNGPARGVDVPRNAQIGNAIPPLVGRALGETLAQIADMVSKNDPILERYRLPCWEDSRQLMLL